MGIAKRCARAGAGRSRRSKSPGQCGGFLVSEAEFDEIFGRIRARNLSYWADPFRKQPDAINRWDDGRGVYFDDPNGHLLEILTRPYGSGGLDAEHPNPLLGQP